jgi:hypothetical protein
LVLPTLHLLWCLAIQAGVIESEGSWTWFFVFLVDFPASLAVLALGSLIQGAPFLLFGLIGTAWWYFISRWLFSAATNASSRAKP